MEENTLIKTTASQDLELLHDYYFKAKSDAHRGFIKALLKAAGYDYDEKYDKSFGTHEWGVKHENEHGIPE